MGLTEEARRAWRRYLEIDGSSAWAVEARAHLAALPPPASGSQFDRDRPRFEQAAEQGDASAVRAFVDTYRARMGAYGEAEYLGRWAEASERGDADDSRRWLTIARAIGVALVPLTGESLLREAVRAIDEASPREARVIAQAHAAYRRGRLAYSRQQVASAERDLREAARLFASTPQPDGAARALLRRRRPARTQ